MAKRKVNGEGNIVRRADGRFMGRAYVTTTGGNRVRRTVYGKTWEEAHDNLVELLDTERRGLPVPEKAWKLGAWLTYWLAEIVTPSVRPGTYTKYEIMSRVYLTPALGNKSLAKLSTADVRRCLSRMQAQGVGAPTVAKALQVLRIALSRAMKDEVVMRNVAQLVDMPTVPKREIKPWTMDEASVFLRTARDHRLYAAFVFMLVLGLRRGEVLGIRWSDLDLGRGEFLPQVQVQRQGTKLVLVELKTKSSRKALPLPRICLEALAVRRTAQQAEKWRAGDKWEDSGQVFTAASGGLLDPRVFDRTFKALCVRAGVRVIRMHDARHTCATLLAKLKVHPSDAKEILRHSSISMTMDVYTHVASDTQRAAAATLGQELRKRITDE